MNWTMKVVLCGLLVMGGCDEEEKDSATDVLESSTEDESSETGDASETEDSTPETETETSWECNAWYPCQDCGGTFCLTEIGSCTSTGNCGSALNNWAACVLDCENPSVCAASFESEGGAPASALLSCVRGSCAEECDL